LSFECKPGSSNGIEGINMYRTNFPYRTGHMTKTPLAICIQDTDRVHRATRIVALVVLYDLDRKARARPRISLC
jgi:hypothetical protein